MGCTLVARGKEFDVESFLAHANLPIKDAHSWIRGTPIYHTKSAPFTELAREAA